MFGPELIDQLTPREVRFGAVSFLWRQPRNFENVTLVAHRRKHFGGVLADCFVAELPKKRGCFNTQKFTRFLSTGVVTALSHAL